MRVVADHDERVEDLSNSARRLLRRPRPQFRGTLHLLGAIASVPIGVITSVLADGTAETVSMVVFALGTFCMFAASANAHLGDWEIHQVETIIRIDHTAIFVMFAASGTPIGLLALDGRPATWYMIVLWGGALLGIAAEWVPVHPPAGFVNGMYLTLGWGMAAFLPWLLDALTLAQIELLLAGAAAYTVGAVVVGARRPDPWPRTFGYHEIWHVLVVVAVVFHWRMAADIAGL